MNPFGLERPRTEDAVRAIQRKAFDLATKKRFDDALGICDWLIQEPTTEIAGLRQRSGVKELAGDLRGAVEDLLKVVKRFPHEPGDFHALGLLQLELGDTQQSVASFGKAVALSEDSRTDYYKNSSLLFRAIANLKLGLLAEAEADCSKLPAGYRVHLNEDGDKSREDVLDEITRQRAGRSR